MASVTWDTILPLVTPDIPTCPDATVKTALAAVSADFCARTHIWRKPLDTDSTVIGEPDYCICSNAIIESVLWILVDNIKLTHTDKRLVNQEDLERTGKPQYFWVNEPDSIRLFYIPDQVWTIKGEVALKPSRTATGIEKWIYETYADVLASGAVYRLAKVPGKEWSNPELAAMHKNLYEQGVTNARIRDFRNVPLMAKQRRM